MRTHPGARFQILTDSLPVLGGRAHPASVCRCPRWKMIKLWKTSCSAFVLGTFVRSWGGFVFNFPIIRDSVISVVFPRNPWAYTESREATSNVNSEDSCVHPAREHVTGYLHPTPPATMLVRWLCPLWKHIKYQPGGPLLSGGTETPYKTKGSLLH